MQSSVRSSEHWGYAKNGDGLQHHDDEDAANNAEATSIASSYDGPNVFKADGGTNANACRNVRWWF